tara:strand:- start:1306 stop:1578 length:273 start_codon:yes stop_codon:yes gene_type:complete
MNIGIDNGKINKGDIRLFDLEPSVKDEQIDPIKQNPRLPIRKIRKFHKIISNSMLRNKENIGMNIEIGIIKKTQKIKHFIKMITSKIKGE